MATGDSIATRWLALATVSTGAGWPDDPSYRTEPGDVVLLSAEDHPADTIRPRLDARVDRIHGLTTIKQADGSLTPFSLTGDLPRLDYALSRLKSPKLVIIDPVSCYLGDTDDHKNGAIRGILAPLADLAAKHNVAVVLVSHLNKNGGGKAAYRTSGSLAFAAAARVAWMIHRDPDDPRHRLMLPVKNNISLDGDGLAYRIVDGVVEWERAPVTMTADEALGREARPTDKPTHDADRAADFLRSYLAHGPKPSEEVVSAGNKALGLKRGMTWWRDSVLKPRLGGRPRKLGFKEGWVWEIPQGSEESNDTEPEESPFFAPADQQERAVPSSRSNASSEPSDSSEGSNAQLPASRPSKT